MSTETFFEAYLEDSLSALAAAKALGPVVSQGATLLHQTLQQSGKVLVCGNGGSAADAQHFVAELVVRFEKERGPLAAVALCTDTSILTACANDYSFEEVFARQVGALGRAGDTLLAISTSGNSPNVLGAAHRAKSLGLKVLALTGEGGGALAPLADVLVAAPHKRTALIQQIHEVVLHFWCEEIDRRWTEKLSP